MAISDLQEVQTIELGRQGENLATSLQFNLQEFYHSYGAGNAVLIHKRPGDTRPYIAAEASNSYTITWNLEDEDTAQAGVGQAEIRYYVGSVLKKSAVFSTYVVASIMDDMVERPGNVVYMTTLGASMAAKVSSLEAMAPMVIDTITNTSGIIAGADDITKQYSGKKDYKYQFIATSITCSTTPSLTMQLMNGTASAGSVTINAANSTFEVTANSDFDRFVITPNVDITAITFKLIEVSPAVTEMASVAQLKQNLSTETTLTGGTITGKYVRNDGLFIAWNVANIATFNVEGLVGETLEIETDENYLAIGAFYTRPFASTTSSVATTELISPIIAGDGGTHYTATVPSGAKTLAITVKQANAENYPKVKIVDRFTFSNYKTTLSEMTEVAFSTNRLNTETIVHGKYCNTSGGIGTSATYCYTDYIPVNTGDVVEIYSDFITKYSHKYVTAYDSNMNVVSSAGSTDQASYTVPEGVSYVVLTMYENRLYSSTRININGRKPFESFWTKTLPVGVDDNLKSIQHSLQYPVSSMPEYVQNQMAYKPIGQLTKPYICFVSDDGNAAANTYTIPMFVSKEVPCTFAIMKSSDVMQTEEQIQTFKNGLANGMSAAQHGGFVFTRYDEKELNEFFDSEKSFFDSVGIEISGAVCPEHRLNKTVAAVAGGRFGVLRSGYEGREGTTGTVDSKLVIHYDHYCNGARSNLFALSSRSATDGNLQTHKTAIDYAVENNLLYVLLFHENELTDEKKTLLEGIIDYAKTTSINFVTLGEIPYLI